MEDPNVELLKVYMWVLVHPQSRQSLQGMASQVLSMGQVEEISKRKRDVVPLQEEVVTVDPNFVYKENRLSFIPICYRERPKYFELGDRVINLNTNGISN